MMLKPILTKRIIPGKNYLCFNFVVLEGKRAEPSPISISVALKRAGNKIKRKDENFVKNSTAAKCSLSDRENFNKLKIYQLHVHLRIYNAMLELKDTQRASTLSTSSIS